MQNLSVKRGFAWLLVSISRILSPAQRRMDSHLSSPAITHGVKRLSANFAHHRWCKIEHPERALTKGERRINFLFAQDSQFCNCLWQTKLEHGLALR